MICNIKADITNVKAGVIVHGVNCQGVMGSGVALALRKKYPQIFESYSDFLAKHGKINVIGHLDFVKISDDLYVVNAFTQYAFGKDGKRYVSYDALDSCFKSLKEKVNSDENLKKLDICFPMIGAGLGGGSWSVISTIIDSHFGSETLYCYSI